MLIKLTEDVVKKAKTSEVQDYLWDTDVEGFGCVVGRTGVKTFLYRGRIDGKRTKKTIGRYPQVSVATARSTAKQWVGKMEAGEDPKPRVAKSDEPTLRDALEFHIGKMERGENKRGKVRSPRSIKTLRGSIELHLKDWLDAPLVDLTADVIDSVRNRIEKKATRIAGSNPENPAGRAASNRLLAHVSVIWRSYQKRHPEKLTLACPVMRLEARAFKPERATRVANDDMPGWYAKVQAMENRVRADLQLASMFCGVRTDGIRHLQWDDVDFDQGLLFVRHAKGDKPYVVVMTKTLREILERREKDDQATRDMHEHCAPWVFPSPDSDEGCIAEVKERVVVKDEDGDVIGRESLLPGVHVNRRTYNSIAEEVGVSKEDREKLLNHSASGVNAKHYTVPDNWDRLVGIAEQIEAGIWQTIRGERKSTKRRSKLRAVK